MSADPGFGAHDAPTAISTTPPEALGDEFDEHGAATRVATQDMRAMVAREGGRQAGQQAGHDMTEQDLGQIMRLRAPTPVPPAGARGRGGAPPGRPGPAALRPGPAAAPAAVLPSQDAGFATDSTLPYVAPEPAPQPAAPSYADFAPAPPPLVPVASASRGGVNRLSLALAVLGVAALAAAGARVFMQRQHRVETTASAPPPPAQAVVQAPAPPPPPAVVAVVSEPRGARILVDGVARADTTPSLLRLEAGRHALRLEKEGFEARDVELTLAAGEDKVVEQMLLGVAPANPEPAAGPSKGGKAGGKKHALRAKSAAKGGGAGVAKKKRRRR